MELGIALTAVCAGCRSSSCSLQHIRRSRTGDLQTFTTCVRVNAVPDRSNLEDGDDGVGAGGVADVHVHGHSHVDPPSVHPLAGRYLWSVVASCGFVTLIAVAVLWPGNDNDRSNDPLLLDADTISAHVVDVELRPCSYSLLDQCRFVQFEMSNGPFADQIGTIEEPTLDGFLAEGDDILVVSFSNASGEPVFSFYDYQRGNAMIWLLAIFVGAVLLLGRWRGLGAIGGLAFSLLVIVVFTLPAILDGSNSLAVALVSASLIAFAALFLAHGIGLATAVALVSTFASLIITAVLASAFVGATHLTGLGDDVSVMLGGLASGIDARGILLAGIVIGALGVLDDVTVTQVSAVWELKRVRPELTLHELVAPALRIGRDHISSTVNTLFLAYAGAALPLLLFFTEAGQGFRGVITRELVAAEVVRTLVGSIGLVASVPIATWLAALVVSGGNPSQADPEQGADTANPTRP